MSLKFKKILCLRAAIFCIATIAFLAPNAFSQSQEGTWVTKSPMPWVNTTVGLFPGGGVVVDGIFYVIQGGSSYNGPPSRFYAYDPKTDQWTQKPDMPTLRGGFAMGAINGIIYVAGGGWPPMTTLEAYDTKKGTWTTLAPMPRATHSTTGAVVNGIFYVIGGSNCSGFSCWSVNTVQAYNPQTNTWEIKKPKPTPITWAGAGVIDGKIYVLGGYDYQNSWIYPLNLEVYDPSTDTWETKAPMFTPSQFPRMVQGVNGLLYVIGGYDPDTNVTANTVEAYDPATDTCTTLSPMPTARSGAASGVLNGMIYVAGGFTTVPTPGHNLATLEVFNINPLVANAGPDQTVPAGTQVQLDGSNSTPASYIVSYQWSQTSGPAVALSDPTIARPTFSAPQVGVGGASLVFQLTVANKSGQSSQAACTVTVNSVNQPPVANAGPAQTVKAGDSVTLDGSKSTDPDNGIASFSWVQTGGPTVQLSDTAAVKPFFTAPVVGTGGASLTFKLTVADTQGLTATDSCIVNVTFVNQPPVANAGTDQTVNSGAPVTLDGSSSTDPDDGIASYQWAQVSGTPITLSDPKAVQPTFNAPHVKYGGDVLAFQLTVTDRGGLQSTAGCAVNVQWVNTPPVAKVAGNLTTLSKDLGLTTLQGTASDADGDPLRYRWLKGTNELFPSQAVGADGTTPLNLGAITTPFPSGQYTLTLEVSDGYAIATDTMQLTVDNSAPTVAPTGEGTFQVNTPVSLGGQVSDYDGDLLSYQWLEGNAVLNSDYVQAAAGGAPVNLPQFTISSLKVGTHTLTLQVSDKVNSPVAKTITVTINDTTSPTLAPMADKTILWPPNKQMVPVTIKANAIDNSGMPVTLKVAVACNESQDGAVYWTKPVIDQNAGTISLQLQADRLGKGNGRQYTVTITATDQSGNFSTANVKILVPHDQGKN